MAEPVKTLTSTSIIEEKTSEVKVMEQLLDGVMFHVFYADLFELLNLTGFHSLHKKQKEEEERNLNKCKTYYIKNYQKLPIIHPSKANYKDLLEKYNLTDLNDSTKSLIVKQSLEAYLDWETQALKTFIDSDEKILVKCVLKELDEIERLLDLFKKYGYDYTNILYVNNRL